MVSPAFRANGTCRSRRDETGPCRHPIRSEHARRGNTVGNDSGARRHDEVGRAALPVAPPAERLHDQHAIEPLLGRARMVDDRRIHFEHGQGADLARSEKAFAAEVVVALDDDIGPNRASRRDTAPARSRRSRRLPSGGGIAHQCTPAGKRPPSPGETSTCTS